MTFHDRSFVNSLRGTVTIVATLLSIVSLFMTFRLASLLVWASGVAFTFANRKDNDWNKLKIHFGILCPRKRKDLANISQNKIIQSSPVVA